MFPARPAILEAAGGPGRDGKSIVGRGGSRCGGACQDSCGQPDANCWVLCSDPTRAGLELPSGLLLGAPDGRYVGSAGFAGWFDANTALVGEYDLTYEMDPATPPSTSGYDELSHTRRRPPSPGGYCHGH